MRVKMPFLADACQVVRPVFICVLAMGLASMAMALRGWNSVSAIMGVMIVLIAAVLIYQVQRSISKLRDQSAAVHTASLEAERHYADVLKRIVQFVESRDRFIEGHSERVGRLAEQIARKMDLPEEQVELLNLAGQLHDVGLLAIPATTLAQQTRLSVEGFRCVKQHSQIGYEVLKPLKTLEPVLAGVRYHHERMNGTGYPDGLVGEQIPIEARILAVADSFDAMTHDRPHRRAITPVDAMRELRRCTPAGYDPLCVDVLAEVVFLSSLPNSEDAPQESAAQGVGVSLAL